MNTPDPELDPITARFRAEQELHRRRVTRLTLIPAFVAVLLVAGTSWQVYRAQSQVATAERRVSLATDSLDDVREALKTTTEEVFRKHAEIDSLETMAETFYDELQKISQGQAEVTRGLALTNVRAFQARRRVYMHVWSEQQRAAAVRFGRVLREAGFLVPDIEIVGKGPQKSELRFFKTEDVEGAKEILSLAEMARVPMDARDLSRTYSRSTSITAGTFEIWFGGEFGR